MTHPLDLEAVARVIDPARVARLNTWLDRGNPPGGMNVPLDHDTPSIREDLRRVLRPLDPVHGYALPPPTWGERAWLIENAAPSDGAPTWFCAGKAGFNWTRDAGKAVRFSRQEDAQQFADWSTLNAWPDCKVTEHVWEDALAKARTIIAMAPPADASQSAEASEPPTAPIQWYSIEGAVPAEGFMLVGPTDTDGIPEVWAAQTYHLALAKSGPEPGWTHLTEAARRIKFWAHVPAYPSNVSALSQSAEVERVGLDVILTGLVGSSRSQPSLTKLTLTYETEEQALAAHEAVTPPAAETEGG